MTNERAIIASDQISNRLRYTHGRRHRQTHKDTNRSHEHTNRNLVEGRQAAQNCYFSKPSQIAIGTRAQFRLWSSGGQNKSMTS